MKKLTTAIILVGCICLVMSGCSKKQPPAQKLKATIVAVYLTKDSQWETCIRYEDNTLSCWEGRKLGMEGDTFFAWRRKNTEYLQDPN